MLPLDRTLHILQIHVTIERITNAFQIRLDFVCIEAGSQGGRRRNDAIHSEEDGTTLGRDILTRTHLVDTESMFRQGRSNFVNDPWIVGTLE